jgi:ABC-type glycerol-3-phosphate transport system permease component
MPGRPSRLALEPSAAARWLAALVLFVTAIISLAPFFYVVSTSLKETHSLFTYPPHWFPDPIYFGNYLACSKSIRSVGGSPIRFSSPRS